MKYDTQRCLVREKYAQSHPGNLGDSCAETSRALILGVPEVVQLGIFEIEGGFLRHPSVGGVWAKEDFSNDQLLPWIMASDLSATNLAAHLRSINQWHIFGTATSVSVGVWALVRNMFWLLNIVNIVQGWLLAIPYRIADGGGIERSEGQVQDYLNMIAVYLYLRKQGKWATLPRSREACMRAVTKYYLEGADFEPNSEWLVNAYTEALK